MKQELYEAIQKVVKQESTVVLDDGDEVCPFCQGSRDAGTLHHDDCSLQELRFQWNAARFNTLLDNPASRNR